MARKNPGTAQLEAAVAKWAKRQNPMAGLSTEQAAEFLRYAREHDRKYDQYFATGPSVYQTCEETARGIIAGKPVASSRKPWPPSERRELLDQFSDNQIPEGHFVRDLVEHGANSIYGSAKRQNPAKLVARTKVMSKAASAATIHAFGDNPVGAVVRGVVEVHDEHSGVGDTVNSPSEGTLFAFAYSANRGKEIYYRGYSISQKKGGLPLITIHSP